MPLISRLGSQQQVDLYEFDISLVCVEGSLKKPKARKKEKESIRLPGDAAQWEGACLA